MNKEPLVSIITPCYNGEHCLARLMDSVIAQTYRPIEFILVNDGSTDGTQELAESYIEKFEEAGISFSIVAQKNKGLGGAINVGLKEFTGDYLCWPDSDDYLEPTSVEERVRVLEAHPAIAVVSSDAYIRDCEHTDTYDRLLSSSLRFLNDPHQFEHHLNGDSIFCSGCHMARVSMFLDVNPDREIYPARRGQNWQLLLPLYCKYPWMFLDKPLYNYVVYPNSMSKNESSLDAILFRYEEHERILNETLTMIERTQDTDMHAYRSFVAGKYAKLKMELAIRYCDRDLFLSEYAKKRRTVGINHRDRISYFRSRIAFVSKMWDFGRGIVKRCHQ